jgi:hypothetical protein
VQPFMQLRNGRWLCNRTREAARDVAPAGGATHGCRLALVTGGAGGVDGVAAGLGLSVLGFRGLLSSFAHFYITDT